MNLSMDLSSSPHGAARQQVFGLLEAGLSDGQVGEVKGKATSGPDGLTAQCRSGSEQITKTFAATLASEVNDTARGVSSARRRRHRDAAPLAVGESYSSPAPTRDRTMTR